ncbi:MAG: GAF domain-containing protein, partial [Methylococcales bacterium]|nr:GAF domain-containing protein [Methylococcales bacterium]
MTFRPRITRVLLGINLMIMVLPLAGIGVLRLYENTLVRQTETELIAQAAFIAATYRAFIKQNIADVPEHYGLSITPAWQPAYQADKRWRPQPGILDLATDDIHPTPKDARLTENVADQPAITVGALLTPILQDAQTTTLAAIRVTNHQGIVVASTGSEIALSLQHRIEIQRALQGETVRLLRQRISDEPSPPLLSISRGAKVRVFIAMPIISDNKVIGSILLSRTPKTIMSTLHGKRHLLYSTIILLMLIVILLSVFTAKTISRPMKALMTQANLAK